MGDNHQATLSNDPAANAPDAAAADKGKGKGKAADEPTLEMSMDEEEDTDESEAEEMVSSHHPMGCTTQTLKLTHLLIDGRRYVAF
jgi:CO dehydrogenase/acetyl-CoA synthase beta subunit